MTKRILSIDLGIKNLGYAIISFKAERSLTFSDFVISFGTYNLDSTMDHKRNHMTERCKAMHEFFKSITSQTTFDQVIIEKQVDKSPMNMSLMIAATTCAYQYTDKVMLFEPRLKFTRVDIEYSTVKKAHKRLSVELARNILQYNPEAEELKKAFDGYRKQDDIADAIIPSTGRMCAR